MTALHGCPVILLFDYACWVVCMFSRITMFVLFQSECDAFLFFSRSTMFVLFQLEYVCFVSVRV